MAAAPGTQYSGLANLMAMQGSGGDNTLVHMSKSELPYLNNLARAAGHPQGLPVNPKTGLPEANILKSILPIAGTILGTMFLGPIGTKLGMSSIMAGAAGAGLGSFGGSLLAGRSLKDAAIGGLISGGLSGLSAGMFGGEAAGLGDTVTQGTTGAAGGDIVGPQLAAVQGTGASTFAGQGLPELGGFGPVDSFNIVTPSTGMTTPFISTADMVPQGYSFEGINPINAFGQNLSPEVAGNAMLPSTYGRSAALAPREGITSMTGFLEGQTAQLAAAPVTTGDIQRAYVDQGIFPKAPSLREGYTPNVKDLRAINQMSEPSYLSRIQQYNPEGPLTRMDFLKTQLKPAATQAGVMLGIDALTEQGAFEPIDYSGYPTGEENKVSPLPMRGLKFESERTGAFPTTTTQALAFAQPGGVPRQRFFNQRFTIPAKTGGGIEALINKGSEPFQEGGLTALEVALSDGDGSGTGTGPGGAAPSSSTAEADTGFGFGIGQGTNSGVDAANAANTAASIAGLGMGVPGLGALASGIAQAGQYAAIPEAQKGSLQFQPLSLFGFAPTIAQQHTNLTTQRELDIGLAAEEEAEAQASFNAAMGLASLAMAAEEAPEDTAAAAEAAAAEAAEAAASIGHAADIGIAEGTSSGGGFGSGSSADEGGFGGVGSGPGGGGAGADAGDSAGDDGPGGTGGADDYEQGGYLGEGGLVSTFAMGGMPSPYFEGRVVGPGDGMSDSIPFSIEGQQPAILSRDEYVLPADIVSMMGNGSSDAGAGKIDSFINDFRMQKYGRGEQPPETNKGLSSIA